MKITLRVLLAIALTVATSSATPDFPAQPLARKGPPVFAEDFSRAELGAAWQSVVPTFAIVDGVLKGTQTRPDHGAVAGAKVALPDGNVILEVKFRFEGANAIHVACDDKSFKGVHAGHISRLTVTPTKISLFDDREGVMRNDIYALRKSEEPAKKAEAQKLALGRSVNFPLRLYPAPQTRLPR